MKKMFLFGLFLSSLLACQKEEATSEKAPDTWKLKAVLADPGDGSGTFQPVNSNKHIIFYADGTVGSNGDLCSLSSDSSTPTTGTYSNTDSTITAPGCAVTVRNIHYKIKGNVMEVYYPCIEPCIARYEK